MKILITLVCSFCIFVVQAQKNDILLKTFHDLKNKSHIDELDSTMLQLSHDLYIIGLQNDVPSTPPSLIAQIQSALTGPKTKNLHLLIALLMYQDAVGAGAAGKLKFDVETQQEIINFIDQEFQEIYKQTPAIVYIYKTESLQMQGQSPELLKTIEQGLNQYPDCIPLKVYLYNNYKNQSVKEDLIQNHASHWLVQLQESLKN